MGNTLQKSPTIPQQQELHLAEQSNLRQQPQPSKEDVGREFTCEICIEPTPNQFKNGNKCSHPFCTDCAVKYIRAKLDDGGGGEIKCPAVGCDHSLEPAACEALVGRELFVRWCDALCEAAISGLERCYCPHRKCNVLIVNECGGIVRKSKCPSCKKLFCFGCKKVWHAGYGCEESRDPNDVAFRRLAEQKKWMRCPSCRHFVELVEGCRRVRCRCGISFCYECGKHVHQHSCYRRDYTNDTRSRCCDWWWFSFGLLILVVLVLLIFWSILK